MEEDIEKIENIDVIKWAFEKGYDIACSDFRDGIIISSSETKKYFLEELEKFYAKVNGLNQMYP